MFIPPEGYQDRFELREASRPWLQNDLSQFELSVTLNFNRDIRWVAAKDKIGEWAQRIDNAYLGSGYVNKPDQRMFFVAFFENADTNPHFHVLVKLPQVPWRRLMTQTFKGSRKLAWHEDTIDKHWRKLIKSGTVNAQKIYGERGVIKYDTKQLARLKSIEHFVISTEFHPTPANLETIRKTGKSRR